MLEVSITRRINDVGINSWLDFLTRKTNEVFDDTYRDLLIRSVADSETKYLLWVKTKGIKYLK